MSAESDINNKGFAYLVADLSEAVGVILDGLNQRVEGCKLSIDFIKLSTIRMG